MTASHAISPTAGAALQLSTVPALQQASGAFDRGKITERKPVGMPHDRAPQKSVGPLFYWAWAESEESGTIAMHPHQGFEILSYMLEGEMFHRDTLGTEGWVTAGGAQVQKAGSGMSHEEITGGKKTGFFQIWLQPDLKAALKREPEYGGYAQESFSAEEESGISTKTILGPGSPISLVTKAQMHDVTISPGAAYSRRLGPGRALVAVAVEGLGEWAEPRQGIAEPMAAGDCTTIIAHEDNELQLRALGDSPLRTVIIEVPLEVSYPLYR